MAARYPLQPVSSTPRSIAAGVSIGEIFIDKYRVDSILGHGGMGVVALCTHLALNERVAIKMLRRDVLDDADAVERFMREAQAASKLKSEYVARVTDVGRSRTNVPYMVMEYLEGLDLGDLLDDRGYLGLPWAIEITLQACEALAEAHSLGIVHRDVKPSNLFVTWRPDGSALIKVLDFGISKALTGGAMELTQTQSLLGTPAYMSPEQMRSARQVDARTDIWSLGTVLYELIEGHRPFEAESFSEMCVKVAVDPPTPMKKAPAALQQVVMRCLAKLPEQRYSSMAELGHDLVPFSHDPHQAQVLVERMTRTLRRSAVMDWEAAVRELPGPERTPEPAAPASSPAIPMPLMSAVAAAAPLVTETYAVPRRKPRRGIAIAVAIAGAATIGVALSRARDARVRSPSPAASRIRSAMPTEPSADEHPAPAGSAAPSRRTAEPIAPARPANHGGDATGQAAGDSKRAPAHPRNPDRTGGKTGKPGQGKAAPDPGRQPDAAPAECDPFAQSHAANACPPAAAPHE